MTLFIPIGIPGSGKSTLGAEYFKPSEIVNPDSIREWLTGDMRDQSANGKVFEIAHEIVQERMSRNLDTYFDATNLDPARWPHAHSEEMLVIVMCTEIDECYKRNNDRWERQVPQHAMERMEQRFHDTLHYLSETNIQVIQSEHFHR